MSNNSSSVDVDVSYFDEFCFSELCFWYDGVINHVAHYYIGGVYVAVAVTGRVLLLLVMLLKGRRRRSGYQLLLVSGEVGGDASKLLYLLAWYWLYDYDWYRRCYWVMWCTVYLSVMLVGVYFQYAVLMALAVAVDRLFALKRPMVYKAYDHRRMQVLLVVGGLLISTLVSVFDCFRYVLLEDEQTGGYTFGFNDHFVNSTLGIALQYVRTSLLLLCLVAMIVVNTALVGSYRKFRTATTASLAKTDDARKRQNQRLLMLMAITQCSAFIVVAAVMLTFTGMQYSSMIECLCAIDAVGNSVDGIMFLVDIVNVLICILLNKMFRNICWKMLVLLRASASSAPQFLRGDSVRMIFVMSTEHRRDRTSVQTHNYSKY